MFLLLTTLLIDSIVRANNFSNNFSVRFEGREWRAKVNGCFSSLFLVKLHSAIRFSTWTFVVYNCDK